MCRRMRHLKPREIQGCQLALDASIATSLYDATSGGSLVAADGAVARWEDQSGNARHVTQGTSGNRPLRRVANRAGLDTLQFDNTNDQLTLSTYSDSSPRSVFAFGQNPSDGAAGIVDSFSSGTQAFVGKEGSSYIAAAGGSGAFPSIAVDTEWGGLVATLTPSSGSSLRRGRVVSSVARNGPNGLSGIRVGASRDSDIAYFWGGYICEIATFDTALGTYVAQRLNDSRSRKWRTDR